MKLKLDSLQNKAAWEQAGVVLPKFDCEAVHAATEKTPVWVHFGAGNIFRGFIAVLQQRLLDAGLAQSGIIAAETFDYELIDKIYTPFDCLTLMVGLRPDGGTQKEIIASVTQGLRADTDRKALAAIFANASLQMASFTITEKGYALTDAQGELFPFVREDCENGPDKARHAMSVLTALMLERYKAGASPIALVSMDNCSHNGEKLRSSVMTIAKAWQENGFAEQGFVDYLADESRVAFPWSMIDKITPRPAQQIQEQLAQAGIEDMEPVVTGKNTYIAPFVNAEIPQYLVIEDRFPNGRPALEKAGVYLTNRDTVNLTERMKVTTCLNPLHTALAVFGCLLGYDSIAAEMRDKELKTLVERIGYTEGMPVVDNPGILNPEDFLREVIEERLPNPFIPDMPQRIATDTSQKIPIRFGETIKAYLARPELSASSLTAIPLAIAGWLRYLLAVDDKGGVMPVSPDPMLAELQAQLQGIQVGNPESLTDQLKPILSNPVIFAVNLYEAGLGEKVEAYLREMLTGPGAVRATLQRVLS